MKPSNSPQPGRLIAGALAALALAWLAGCAQMPKNVTPIPRGSSSQAWNGPVLSVASLSGQSEATRALLDAYEGSFPSPDEELWVIARAPRRTSSPSDDLPASGALMTRINDRETPLPLKHTDVRASIGGYIASVRVTQQFHNPYDGKIEAVYVFPLPENAAVNEFVMTIGDRRIRGIIREREEAEKIYQEAKSQGFTASLLTQERPNIFTQSVANIEPGREVDVTIRYFHTLAQTDGWHEFVFPMVVGPRFNPPGSTKGIGAVANGSGDQSGQVTDVNYLRPGERSGHDIGLTVELDAGVEVEEIVCPSHQVVTERQGSSVARVTLSSGDAVPNKDFVLRYRVAGDRIKSSLLTHHDERGGFFTLLLQPPAQLRNLHRQPLELVFVLDCSGSMSGRPLEQAKAAVERALGLMEPADSFQIINFSEHASKLGGRPLEASPANIRRGLAYLRSLNSEGGTMMLHGIQAALDFPHDPERLRFVCFLTDGFIGNESEILREVQKRLGEARIFSFGVGSAPNRYLLDSMAKLGRGAVAYLGHDDNAGQLMDDFFARISHPALTDVRIDWDGLDVKEVFPRRVPDLFVGRPVTLTGRFTGSGSHTLRITGKSGRERMELKLPVNLAAVSAAHEALPSVWARQKISHLAADGARESSRFYGPQIKQVALDYGLLSAFTAFVAVDASRRTEGRQGTVVPVPVPVPQGVRYDTTVGE